MEPQLKVNVLEDNRVLFGDAEVRLLHAIAQEGTLADGAATLGLSYRVAWGKLRAVEQCLGTRLIETTVGGSGGGSSRLTETAVRLVSQYRRFREAVAEFAVSEFEKCFGESPDCTKLASGPGAEPAPIAAEGRGEIAAILRVNAEAAVAGKTSGEKV